MNECFRWRNSDHITSLLVVFCFCFFLIRPMYILYFLKAENVSFRHLHVFYLLDQITKWTLRTYCVHFIETHVSYLIENQKYMVFNVWCRCSCLMSTVDTEQQCQMSLKEIRWREITSTLTGVIVELIFVCKHMSKCMLCTNERICCLFVYYFIFPSRKRKTNKAVFTHELCISRFEWWKPEPKSICHTF